MGLQIMLRLDFVAVLVCALGPGAQRPPMTRRRCADSPAVMSAASLRRTRRRFELRRLAVHNVNTFLTLRDKTFIHCQLTNRVLSEVFGDFSIFSLTYSMG